LSIEKWRDREPEVILHDNQEDPFQLRNVAEERPEIVEELTQQELFPWLEETNDPWLDS
jgi:hypothetical protein